MKRRMNEWQNSLPRMSSYLCGAGTNIASPGSILRTHHSLLTGEREMNLSAGFVSFLYVQAIRQRASQPASQPLDRFTGR